MKPWTCRIRSITFRSSCIRRTSPMTNPRRRSGGPRERPRARWIGGRDPRRRQVESVSPVAELRRGRVRMTHDNRQSRGRRYPSDGSAGRDGRRTADVVIRRGSEPRRDAPPANAPAAPRLPLRRRGCVGVDSARACAAGSRRTGRERAAKGRRIQIEARRGIVYVSLNFISLPSSRSFINVNCFFRSSLFQRGDLRVSLRTRDVYERGKKKYGRGENCALAIATRY